MTQKYDRFKSAPWFQEGIKPSVLVGGAGGIGSWLTVLLNRAGFETYVFDFDTLEEINMAGQLFMHKSIGMTKVDALAEITRLLCREEIVANLAKVDEDTMTNEIVFSAFDNIKARRDMFTTWAQNYKGRPDAIFVDGRLTAEQLTIFSIRGNDEEAITEYLRDELPDDSTIPELDCTLKQTSHGAAMIAAHMVEMFTNWYSGVLGRDDSRYVPYYWSYIIPLGLLETRDAGSSLQESKEGAEYTPTLEEVQAFKEDIDRSLTPGDLLQVFVPPIEVMSDYYYVNGYPVHKSDSQMGSIIAESDSVTNYYLMTVEELQEKFPHLLTHYAVGIDPAKTDDNPTGTVTIYGTAGEFENNGEVERMFYNPPEPTPEQLQPIPGVGNRAFIVNLGDECFGIIPSQPVAPTDEELQRASEELNRWEGTQNPDSPVPNSSILEDGPEPDTISEDSLNAGDTL